MNSALSTTSRAVTRDKGSGRRGPSIPPAGMSPSAARIRELSLAVWGKAVEIVGRSPQMESLLARVEKIAFYREPVLILGESGVGKESLAQSLYLLSPLTKKPFIPVNCPQYQEGNVTVSELFGHKKGSYTGATGDRKGCFETADGGVIFLDEIGDLHMSAQVILLRALATGEFQSLGSDRSRTVNVRVVSATNRPLNWLVAQEQFRRDLLFRLRAFQLEIPPLRERGDDWLLLLEHFLGQLRRRYGVEKRFSRRSLRLLEDYPWPGNVRELRAVTTTGYALADGEVIEPRDFVDDLLHDGISVQDQLDTLCSRLRRREGTFWDLVQQPYLDRDLNRGQVRRLIDQGLSRSRGGYRRLLDFWNVPADQYQKFMDFLRHHRLKPKDFGPIPDEPALDAWTSSTRLALHHGGRKNAQ